MAVTFVPVRAEESVINSLGYNEGYLYFAKDTGKIFLDVDNIRKTMGGAGVSVFYAEAQKVVQDTSDNYLIERDSLQDKEATPKQDDLIINIPNGYFYRVLEVEETRFICSVLAVSGTGGGGGGGTGDPDQPKNYVTLEQVTPIVPQTFVYGQDYYVTYKATAPKDQFINIAITVTDGVTDQQTFYNYRATNGVAFNLNIGSYLPLSSKIRVVVEATSDNTTNTAQIRHLNRATIKLGLKKVSDFNPKDIYGTNNKFLFKCMPVGAVTKKLEIYVDDVLAQTATIESSISDSLYTVGVDNQSHGAHRVKAILSADINGTTVTTDPIEYEVAWKEEGNNTPIIWCPELYTTSIIQYEDLIIPYMVYVPGKEKDIEVSFYKAGELSTSRLVTYSANQMLSWNITDYVIGTNNYAIVCGSTRKNFTVIVEKDTVRNMEILTGGLVLNLDSSGRSNEEYPSSRSTWTSKDTPVATAVRFKNFNWYNNGWIQDENGRSCLRVSNGASIEIPISSLGGGIFTSQKATQALAFEFRFKLRNVRRYNTLIKYELENDIPVQKVTGDEAWCKYYNTMGFCIGTQEAFIKSSNSTVSAKYKEDEYISLTFVVDSMNEKYPLLYIYLNGILSGITQYGDSDTFNANETLLKINSDYCDVDLYKIRIYKNVKLNSADVVHNYISDLKDAKEYDINQITTTTNNVPTIDYNKMINFNATYPDETIIPYMVIESKDNILPYVKGGTKVVHIDFTNPALDYAYENGLIDAATYMRSAPSFKYAQDFTYDKAKGSLNVQGTSSQGYPRRNFKWKGKQKDATWVYTAGPAKGQPVYQYDAEKSAAKGKDVYVGAKLEDGTEIKKWHLDSDIGETTFCFKADYMESSGTYNTGFASFVKEMYSKHPLVDYGFSQENTSGLRTTIYGFPILVFQKIGEKQYDFVGRYNLNLDKGCSDSYGFTYDGNSKVKDDKGNYEPMEKIAECWEFSNNQGGRCSFRKTDFDETVDSYVQATGITADTFVVGKYFRQEAKTDGTGFNYIPVTEFSDKEIYYTKESGTLAMLGDFEYRYSYYDDDIDDCVDGVGDFAGKTQEERNSFLLDKYKNLQEVAEWLKSTSLQDVALVPPDLPKPVTYGTKTYTKDDRDYRKAKFLAEFKDHFDAEYCEIYYIMTELFHLYDSRGKNLMLATWGPQKEGGNYIWYPIFYDIDTQLGINNSGVPTWDYAAEPSKDNNFSTSDSVLWQNLWECFKNNILDRYADLRKNKLTITEVNAFYNGYPIASDPSINSWKEILADENSIKLQASIKSFGKIGKKPVMTYNVDQYYKYISPTLTGFVNTSGNIVQDSGSFFYCLQGSRDLSRYLYLRNRFNFVDSMWYGGSYAREASKQEYWTRYDANYPGMTSDTYLMTDDSSLVGTTKEETFTIDGQKVKGTITYTDSNGHPLDCVGDYLNVKSYLAQYMSLYTDDAVTEAIPCDGEHSVNLMLPESIRQNIKYNIALTQQLVYMGGGEYISDLGDLSMKYLDELHIPTLKRLNSLILGSDIPGYFNNQLNPRSFVLGDSAYINGQVNENAKTLLEKVVLNGLGGLTAPVDVTGSEKLKEFRALRTKITGVQLADGVQIETLHLPESVTTLKLTEPVALKNILTSPTSEEDGATVYNKGLYIENLTDVDMVLPTSTTHLNEINITGGNFGYDSYKLLDKTVKIKQAMQSNAALGTGFDKKTNVSLTNVQWSPYTVVEYGEPFDSNTVYYQDNDRFELVKYTGGEENWEFNTSNDKIYTYTPDATNEATIIDLKLFKVFIDNYNEAIEYYNNNDYSEALNYFRDASSSGVTLPEITGIIYVNNTETLAEDVVANTYLKNFPNLKFFIKNLQQCYTSQFVSVVDGTETKVYSERISLDTENAHVNYPDPTLYAPIKFNYDFIGWNTDSNATVALSQEEIEAMKFDADHKVYKFYAIFQIHSYEIRFYTYDSVTGEKTNVISYSAPSGSYLSNPSSIPRSPQEERLALNMRYKFIGWVTDKLNCYPDNEDEAKKYIVDLTTILSENRDRNFYACYIQENALENITDLKYFSFEFEHGADSAHLPYTDPDGVPHNGYSIMLSSNYVIEGKITLPTTYNGKPIITTQRFSGKSGITHIFMKGDDNLLAFFTPNNNRANGSFVGDVALKYVQIPVSIKEIMQGTFEKASLESSMMDLSALKNLKRIGYAAFSQVNFSEPTVDITIPGNVTYIGDIAFGWFETSGVSTGIGKVQLGGPGDPCQLSTLSPSAFSQGMDLNPQDWTVYYSSEAQRQKLEEMIDACIAESQYSSVVPTKHFIQA